MARVKIENLYQRIFDGGARISQFHDTWVWTAPNAIRPAASVVTSEFDSFNQDQGDVDRKEEMVRLNIVSTQKMEFYYYTTAIQWNDKSEVQRKLQFRLQIHTLHYEKCFVFLINYK